ncbi:MAG: tRNA (adenosine(37)-N6)-threonylcarbamoyltransferase complex dimerization subunit type 1 TsaB [Candidatus Dasytiphilus stammeri]
MRILALDTSTEVCSVALFNQGQINWRLEYCYRNHSQRLLPLIQQILIEDEIYLQDLDAVAYSRGPGSFTGLRIGMGVAQGLGIGAELSMIEVSTLALMAETSWRIMGTKRVLVALEAKRGLFYWAEYRRDNISWYGKETETVLSTMEMRNRISQLTGSWGMSGNGWNKYPELTSMKELDLIKSTNIPIARYIFPLVMEKLKINNNIDPIKLKYYEKKSSRS